MKKISIVVPCYNEQESINSFYNETINMINKIKDKYEYEIIFINDGSKDKTEQVIKKLREQNEKIVLISFSRNFGKEAAIYAGLSNARR